MSEPPTWYHARTPAPPPHPPLGGTLEAGFAVVGGGLAGLHLALSLAERGCGPEVVLLEAETVAFGASGRNGGMASAGFTRSVFELEARFGRDAARALFDASAMGLEVLRRRIEQYTIDCDRVTGVAEVSWFDDREGFARKVEIMNTVYGRRLEFWPRERVREIWRSDRYYEAAIDPDGFHLDPLALCRGLAAAAGRAGVRIFEHSPAIDCRRDKEGFVLTCRHGRVHARRVILCPNVYGRACDRRLARALLPVASYVIVTEPLGSRLDDVIRAPFAVFDDRMATGYYRPVEGGRLLWGGRVGLFERRRGLASLMRADLAQVYPQLADVRVDFAWAGRMGFARHKMPVARELEPGLWVAAGFGGQGLNTTAMAGELIAAALLEGDARWRLFEPFGLPWVADGLGRLLAQLYYWAHACRDAARAGLARWRF